MRIGMAAHASVVWDRSGDSQEGQALAETLHGMFSRGADGAVT